VITYPNLLGVGTPLIFSRRGDGGEVLEVITYPNLLGVGTPLIFSRREDGGEVLEVIKSPLTNNLSA